MKDINDFIRKNPNLSSKEGAEKCGITDNAYRKRKHRLGVKGKKEPLKTKLHSMISKSKKRHSLVDLAKTFNAKIHTIEKVIKELEAEGINIYRHQNEIEISNQINKSDASIISNHHLVGERVKFGFVTDNHLCSKYERLDVLNALYKRFEKEGITTVYNAGNVIDGEARFNKFDIHTYGMENQCRYFAKAYPQIKGIDTYFITGDDHEGWYVQREGVNIGKFMEQKAIEVGRTDLHYLGHMEHDLILKAPKGKAVMRIVHPGGGSAYAISYTSQKLVESYSPGEKPNILLMGHYHKMEFNYIRGVYVVQGGTTMDQSPFMRKKRLDAHLGGWICEYQQGVNGTIQSFKGEWIPFYGKEFYNKNWAYHY